MEKKMVFICFDPADQKQAEAFALLREKSGHALETHDLCYAQQQSGGSAARVPCPFNDSRAKDIREQIARKLGQCSKLAVLIGNDTHKNAWIDWEILNFHKMKDKLSLGNAWKVIRGIYLPGCDKASFPKALECRSTKSLLWEPESLEKWIEE